MNTVEANEYAKEVVYRYNHRFDSSSYCKAIEWISELIHEHNVDDTDFGEAAAKVANMYNMGISTVCFDASCYAVDGVHRG